MSQTPKEPVDELDVEAAIGDDEPITEEARALAVTPEDRRDLEDAMEPEDLEEQLEDGTPGPEEQSLHVEEPLTQMLDDEIETAEDTLDEEQRAELEWRMGRSRRR